MNTSPTREHLVAHPHLFFQSPTQKSDLLDENLTDTRLIAQLLYLLGRGWIIEITAIRSDHHDDRDLGTHAHWFGRAADMWPLDSPTAGDYVDQSENKMRQFLTDVAESPWNAQIGLAGNADIEPNQHAAGATYFSDDGGDHIHLGV